MSKLYDLARHDDPYFLGHSSVEQKRLQQQAEELAEESAQLFDRIGLAQGSRVVEIGCGPQGCLELLSNRVGPTGSVVGVELSDHAVQLAREFLTQRRIDNVEVRQGHAADTGLAKLTEPLFTVPAIWLYEIAGLFVAVRAIRACFFESWSWSSRLIRSSAFCAD